jgi:hypothetical protein
MNLDALGITLYEGALLTLGAAPGAGLWASLGRREVVLCQIFASAYTERPIRHISRSNWEELAASSANPGAFLLNLELEFTPLVLDYISNQAVFCLVGLYSNNGFGRETLLAGLPPQALIYDLPSVEHLSEPLRLLTAGKASRLALSLSTDNLGEIGDLLGVGL